MLTIGRLSKRIGVGASAIRYYESQGVLPRPFRLPNGYRVYGEEAVAAVRFVRSAQALGFTLTESSSSLSWRVEDRRPVAACKRSRGIISWRLRLSSVSFCGCAGSCGHSCSIPRARRGQAQSAP